MSDKIIVSIKPIYMNMILENKKFHEFRKVIPKSELPEWIYVYETAPISALKYLFKVDKAVIYPQKVVEKGYGDAKFNSGLSKNKIAYPILEIYELENSIDKDDLRHVFNFIGPQSHVYLKTYPKLEKYMENIKLKKIL